MIMSNPCPLNARLAHINIPRDTSCVALYSGGQLSEQRKKKEHQLKQMDKARRAKAAGEAKLRLASEQKLAALAALPPAERRRRNAQLKASRDFSDAPDETAPVAPACQPKPVLREQPKPAFKPAGSYSSLKRTAGQNPVATHTQKPLMLHALTGRLCSRRQKLKLPKGMTTDQINLLPTLAVQCILYSSA